MGVKLDFFDLDTPLTRISKLILHFTNVLPGGNIAVKRTAMEAAGGFDPQVNLSSDYWFTQAQAGWQDQN